MESPIDLLSRITEQLAQLSAEVRDLQHRTTRLRQDNTWDINIMRQELATQHNLHSLGTSLASKEDLSRALETLCHRVAALRFESHQEHQELLRFMDEGPYGCAVGALRTGGGGGDDLELQGHGVPRERTSTLTRGSTVQAGEEEAVVEPSSPRVIAVRRGASA